MKSYLELIPITAKVRKRQNRMTLLCIVIAVCLVTAIFSMADMAIRMEKNRIIEKEGSWHIYLENLSDAQLTELAGRSDVRASRVSPVAAVSGNTADSQTAARPIGVQTRRIEVTLGIYHAMASPRNLFLMTGSFALSIILILSFSVLVQWIHGSLNLENPDAQSVYFMFSLFVYGFLAVITLITAIHTVNSIAMSVSARTKLYGTLRAVGMDSAQLKRMIFAEAATYTTLGFAVGMGLGLPLHRFLYTLIITHYWGTAWQVPFGIVGGILALLACISFIAPFAPAKRICAMPVTAAVKEL